ncbi:hypothetical protein DENSPDRAFT_843855 [Dentipellis sp. KUC8613]|nr:hypothetical protein DENSPDRAFT_843855 [Dentipellis sp. KUC8613]
MTSVRCPLVALAHTHARPLLAHLVQPSRLSLFAHRRPKSSVLAFPPILIGHLDATMLVDAKTSNSPRSRNGAIRNLSIYDHEGPAFVWICDAQTFSRTHRSSCP